MVNDDVLKMIANVLDMCIDELDESITNEERVLTLDRALKSMVAVGRWSVLRTHDVGELLSKGYHTSDRLDFRDI
jgi:hypothetical protein